MNDLEEALKSKNGIDSDTPSAEQEALNSLQEDICISLQQAYECHFSETITFRTTKISQISSIVHTLVTSETGKITSYVSHSSMSIKRTTESFFSGLYSVNEIVKKSQQNTYSVSTEAKQTIWISWANEAQKLVSKCCNFMKKIPDFNNLSIEDRMTLMKSSFVELLVFTHYDCWRIDLEAYVCYDAEYDEVHFIPFYYLSQAIFGEDFLRICLR